MDERMDDWMDEWMDKRMDEQMDKRTEDVPILKNFVPYRGCCPASIRNHGRVREPLTI